MAEGQQKRTPRGRRVLTELRELILTGRIAPGEVLVEPQLAERFATSKTPVREALHVLAAERLVTVLPKKGYLVATMTPQDLAEVLDLRMLLEPHAAAEAARHASATDLARLHELLEAQRRTPDPIERMQHAAGLHRALTQLGRNTRLAASLEHCFDETARAHHVLGELNAHMETEVELREHAQILDAVAAGNPEATHAAMQDHLRTIHTVTLQHWSQGHGLWD
ncbi:GntR family transcriptional regulator [Micrococcus sp.]|uniref:GntR family transcriptional regulator n=1 Tax=Micrococcus sp. TaxID=1271 RepID=UPI002A91D167|nr:GntR family transcriptional regulator [Micrococcus sp.]MDY6054873.1 GntR family transcriptional regulator [Micrococcus sp.]